MQTATELNARTQAKYGLLVDYQWCTGCHSCEIACQMEHQLPVGQSGILVHDMGHWPLEEGGDEWQFGYLPAPNSVCDTCAHRRSLGKVPTCVQHCQAQCLTFGGGSHGLSRGLSVGEEDWECVDTPASIVESARENHAL